MLGRASEREVVLVRDLLLLASLLDPRETAALTPVVVDHAVRHLVPQDDGVAPSHAAAAGGGIGPPEPGGGGAATGVSPHCFVRLAGWGWVRRRRGREAHREPAQQQRGRGEHRYPGGAERFLQRFDGKDPARDVDQL